MGGERMKCVSPGDGVATTRKFSKTPERPRDGEPWTALRPDRNEPRARNDQEGSFRATFVYPFIL